MGDYERYPGAFGDILGGQTPTPIDVLDDISHDIADLTTRLAAVRWKAKNHGLKRIEDSLARAEQRLRHTHDDVERLIYEEADHG